jgi:hypothetical protein
MTASFSLSPKQCSKPSDPSLRTEINGYTGNDIATSGIIRSIERFGDDESIERYEISLSERGRYAPKTQMAGWIVRAVRAAPPPKS